MTDGAAGSVAFVLAMLLLVGPLDLASAVTDEAIRNERRAAAPPKAVVPRYWDVDEGYSPKRVGDCGDERARITISYNNGTGQPWLRFCTESASLRWLTEGGE